jgi:hypothetical protein
MAGSSGRLSTLLLGQLLQLRRSWVTEKLTHIDLAKHVLLFYGLVEGNLGLEPGYQATLIQICSQEQLQSIKTSCVGKQMRFQWILISLQDGNFFLLSAFAACK